MNAEVNVACSLDVGQHGDLKCVTEYSADFFLQASRGGEQKDIGQIVTYVVEKDTKDGKGKPVWIKELLTTTKKDIEVSTIFKMLFTKTGAVHADFKKYSKELSASRIMFIHTCTLAPPYRSLGLAQVAMQAFFQGLPKVTQGYEFTGPIVLSPAADETAKAEMVEAGVWTDEATAEAGLIRSWGRSGFKVWLQGSVEEEDSISIMGMAAEDWQ